MKSDALIKSPVGDYELLDFGAGRKLERFGPYVLNRPEPLASGAPTQKEWHADWLYRLSPLGGEWQAQRDGLEREWSVLLDGVRQTVSLAEGGEVAVAPEQVVCWRWVSERLAGCYHMQELRVLSLFGGVGGVTAIAHDAGAEVTHVDGDEQAILQAQQNLEGSRINWVHDDIHDFVDIAIREKRKYDLIVLRPPRLQRGPDRSWDINCDLTTLMRKLPRLVSDQCRGVWLGPRTRFCSAESLESLLSDELPPRSSGNIDLVVTDRAGRALPGEVAAYWFDEEEFISEDIDPKASAISWMSRQLMHHLDSVLSSQELARDIARQLSECGREQQEAIMQWLEMIARTNVGMAYQFIQRAPKALELMNMSMIGQWIDHAMDAFDRRGVHAGVVEFQRMEQFAEEARQRDNGVVLEDVAAVLELLVQGLGGRRLKVENSREPYTDTETIFLPSVVSCFTHKEDNYLCYKAMAVYLWAQTVFGTYDVAVEDALQAYDDYERALGLFSFLEGVRLSACIARVLPGLYREIQRLDQQLDAVLPSEERPQLLTLLQQENATVGDTLEALNTIYAGKGDVPGLRFYQGLLKPQQAAAAKEARLLREKGQFRSVLARLAKEVQERNKAVANELTNEHAPGFKFVKKGQQEFEQHYELLLDGKPMEINAEAKSLIASILQDLGEIPPEYLQAAGDGVYHLEQERDKSATVWEGTYHEEGAFLYNEWDCKRGNYRKNWSVLREIDVTPRDPIFVARTLKKYSGLVRNIRHTFEALRGEDKMLKKQTYGDDVDIDAVVEAYADVSSGLEMTDRLFVKRHKLERDIAVMFMVDMSGSTKGWINDAERESLVLLCEALETLGDRYAIYGFSGITRKRCELYKVKGFDDVYSAEVKGRISGIEPKDYTRMGVTIRHLSAMLNQVEARTKLLITLSDGKPDDYDGYRGEYGIEDTRMALIEAKRDGIHSFCITIDREANDYLPHMYGAVNYAVIDEVRKLPLKVSDIYRKLTT